MGGVVVLLVVIVLVLWVLAQTLKKIAITIEYS